MLTIGPDVTFRGEAGQFNADSGSIANEGTIDADTAGGTLSLNGSWTNVGTIETTRSGSLTVTGTLGNQGIITDAGGSLTFANAVSNDVSGIIREPLSAAITVTGNLVGATVNSSQFAPAGEVLLAGSGTSMHLSCWKR